MATKKAEPPQKKKASKARAVTGRKKKIKPAIKKKAGTKERLGPKEKARKGIAPKNPEKRKSPASSERPLFSIRSLARLFGYAEATIREHINKNDGPVEERVGAQRVAKLDPAKWLRFFLDQQAGTSSPLLRARTEKLQIEAASKRLEHKLRTGQVVEVEAVIEFFSQVMLSIGTALDGISGKSAEGDAVLRAQFLKEVGNARKRIHTDIESYLGRIEDGPEFNPAAAKPNRDPVGSRKKSPAKRRGRARAL